MSKRQKGYRFCNKKSYCTRAHFVYMLKFKKSHKKRRYECSFKTYYLDRWIAHMKYLLTASKKDKLRAHDIVHSLLDLSKKNRIDGVSGVFYCDGKQILYRCPFYCKKKGDAIDHFEDNLKENELDKTRYIEYCCQK